MSRLELRLLVPAACAWIAAAFVIGAPAVGWWVAGASGLLTLCVIVIGRAGASGQGPETTSRPPEASPGSERDPMPAGALPPSVRRGRLTPRGVAGTVAVCAASIGLVAAVAAGQAPGRHPEALDSVLAGHSLVAEVTVASGVSEVAGGGFDRSVRWEFRATATSVSSGRVRVTARMPVLVFADRIGEPPPLGARLTLHATAKPGAAADSSAALLFASSLRIDRPPSGLLAATNALRTGFARATASLPGLGGELLPGLALGDISRVDAGLGADMKAASLTHLTAVSGSNCAVIVSGLIWLAGLCGLGRGGRAVTALLGLGAFVVLVTPGPSVLRAAVMATVLVVGQLGGRAGRGLSALSLAVVGLLAWNPWLGRDYGFALSVLATGGLLLLAPPLQQRLTGAMPDWLARGLAIPVAAQLACQPVLVLLNPSVPLYGIVANVLAEPAAAPATVLGLLGCLAQPILPPLASLLDRLAWLPAEWIARVAGLAASLPGAGIPWLGGAAGVLLAAAVTALVALLVARGRGPRWRRMRATAVVALVVAGALGGAASAGPVLARALGQPRDWMVGACDIGQGDAIVLHDGDAYGLVDTGPEPAALRRCLGGLGIHRLGLLVLTHYDMDHIGGADAVVGRVGTAVVGPPDDAVAQRRVDSLAAAGAAVHVARRGDTGTLGALRWTVLWPDADTAGLSSNERGVALLVEGHGIRMLLLADLDQRAQDALLRLGDLGRIDVVKFPHHGSADQSERLSGLIGARLALISCGAGNDYGHPTAHALELLHAAGTAVARTDLEGTALVSVVPRGTGPPALSLWTQRHASAQALWTPAHR